MLGVAASLLLLSLILFTYERALIPLYASGPTNYTLKNVILTASLAAAVHPFIISATQVWLYAALALSLAPNATYWVAVWTSRRKDPVWGPTITHVTVLAPLIFIWATCIIELGTRTLTQGRPNGTRPPVSYRLLVAGICYAVGTLLSGQFWPRITYLNQVSESEIFLALAGIAYAVWILVLPMSTTPSRPRKKNKHAVLTPAQVRSTLLIAVVALWWSVYPRLSSPVLSHPLKETYTHPKVPLQILSSVQSTTGLIVVGQSLSPSENMHAGVHSQEIHSARFLRASHSILGGVWIGEQIAAIGNEPAIVDSFGTQLGDSIYSTFVLQEAVRLINSTEKGRSGSLKNGLIIGLGTGMSATAFQRHGISTTIVEIDPAVYNAARTFFGFTDPGPDKVFLEDARSWVATKRASIQAGNREMRYDFVVHDCFSGGGVPEQLFTLEFWEDLKTILRPDGVVVVNFAGFPKSDSSKMVLLTLEKSFGQCRGFHDLFESLQEDKYETEFLNIVFFCTSSKAPLTFRVAILRDALGSPLRRHVLGIMPDRELRLDLIRPTINTDSDNKYILTDAHNLLGKLQRQQSLHHWSIMREVLPDVHWETY